MVFRVSSSSKRSARETCLMALIMAGVGSGSGACSGSSTGAGTGAAARSGARSTVGGGGLGLFLLPGGLPLPRFFGSGAATGSAAGGTSSLAPAGSAATSAADCPGRASASGAGASSMAFFLQAFFQFVVRPSSSPVQVDAEAQAGAAQVDHVALVVGELEAQVPQRDRAPDVDHVVLVGVRLHDVAHALLADDLGDDVVAQRPHRVGRVGQAAAAKVDLRVRLHLHEGEDLLVARLVHEAGAQQVVDAQGLAGRGALRIAAAPWKLGAQLLVVQDPVVGHLQLVARLHVGGAGEVAADPGGQAHAGVGARGQLGPVQRAEGRVFPVQVGAAVGAQEGVGHPDLEDAQAGGALQVHRLAHVELEVGVGARHAPAAVHPDGRHGLFLPTKEPPHWAGQAAGRVGRDLRRPGRRLLPGLLHPGRLGRVVGSGRGGAAVNVSALALAQGAAPQELAEDRPQHGSHLLLVFETCART